MQQCEIAHAACGAKRHAYSLKRVHTGKVMSMKLLLAEDEQALSNAIAKGLRKQGFAVDQAFDGQSALEMYEINSYDLLILDLNLPLLDGMDLLAQIRRGDGQIKVLVLSARSSVADRVKGLNAGANDYLVKPFDFEELIARINNLLRQSFVQMPSTLSIRNVSIDLLARTASVYGEPIALTNKEYGILEYLMRSAGRTVSQSELIQHVWESEADPFSNALKFQMHSLKKKLGDANIISTVRGQGYRIDADDAKSRSGCEADHA